VSTNHPFDPNQNDLPTGRGADARQTGADALDALLNEITQGTRSTTTRHGEGHDEPKGRSQTRDTQDDLPAFAHAFHQRVEHSDAGDPGGTALDPTLWEQIMARSTPSQPIAATAAAGHPGTIGATRPGRSRTAASPSRFLPPRLHRQVLGNATLALLVILTAFSAWTVYDRVLAPPPSGPGTTVPGVAIQPATPEATESDAQIDAPPVVTTREPAFDCDFTRDMPIFQQVDESPIDGTGLLVTTSGELVLSCPEEPEPIVLASNVGQAAPAQWPGIVYTASLYDEGEMPDEVYINAFTGKSVAIGKWLNGSVQGGSDIHNSPWLIHPSDDESGRWAITDFRTMETRLLDEVTGTTWPAAVEGSTADSINIAMGANSDIVTIWPSYQNVIGQPGEELNGSVDLEASDEGHILVINASLDDAHWLTLPVGLPPVRHTSLSPDGTHLALIASDYILNDDPVRVISIVNVTTGEEVARSDEGIYSGNFELSTAWVQDGDALAFIQNNALNLLTVDGERTVLLEVEGTVSGIRNTYDPNVVTVQRIQEESIATETPDPYQPLMYSVNTVTGDVIEIQGSDVREMYGWEQPPSVYLVVSDDWAPQGPTTYRVLDAVTGEEYGTIEDAALADMGGMTGWGRRSLTTSADGSVEVLAFNSSQLYLIHPTIDGPEVLQFASPPGVAKAYRGMANIFLSPDGSMLSLTVDGDESRTRWLISFAGDNDAWVGVPSTVPGSDPGYILFVAGTGARG
jgi:hypothetical protein